MTEEAPEFPNFDAKPTDAGWILSNKAVRDILEFKLNLYPEYLKTMQIVFDELQK